MSTDSSKPTEAHNPVAVAVEGLVLRPEVFNTPGPDAGDDGKPNLWPSHAAAAAREKADFPIIRDNTFPLWALIPIIGVVLAAGSFLGANMALGPNVKGYAYELTPPDGEAAGGPELDEYDPKVWLAKGKAIYSVQCIACHGPGGEGLAGVNPPLKASEFVIHGEVRPVAILLRGIVGALQVNGKAYNGVMQPLGANMTSKQLAQLISYIRSDWGNGASIVYDDQITEFKKTLTGTALYPEAELRAIPQDANLPPSKHGGAAPADPAAVSASAAPTAPAPAAAPAPAPAPAASAPPGAPVKN